MSYFTTNSVTAFPTAYRTTNVGGRYTSEMNFTNLVKSFLAERDSFVVGYLNGSLRVIINGYYFEIEINTLQPNLYLYINVRNGFLVNVADSTVNLDEDGNFVGLGYTNSPSTIPADCSQLQVTDNEGNIINTGFIKDLIDPVTGKWVDIANFIKILSNNTDSEGTRLIDPTYIDNTIAVTLEKFTVGAANKLVDTDGNDYNVGGKGLTQQWVYFSNGIPVAGNKTTISTAEPSGTGAEGDIWFVIRG